MSLLLFLVIFAIVVSMLYMVVPPQYRKGLLLAAASLTLLSLAIAIMKKEPFTEIKANEVTADGKVKIIEDKEDLQLKAACDSINISDALTIYTLPQVDILGRNIDDKMAMNQTASRVVVPGGINAVFERTVSDNIVTLPEPEPSSGSLTGSPLF
jgi:hypothetical protein